MIDTSEHSPQRKRVLLLAYACSPIRGSEAAVGWNRAIQSAKRFDTWVICEEREFAGEIRQYLDSHGEIPGLHFVFVPISAARWTIGQFHSLLWYSALRGWHRRAFRVARRLHEDIRFDLVHQVNFCGYREPGYLWKLDAPFVWGPIGGTQNYPWRFLPQAGVRGALTEGCRNVLNLTQLRWSPRVRRAARKAEVILAATSTNRRDLARVLGVAPAMLSDLGIATVADTRRSRVPRQGPLRILWSGSLAHHKALHLLLWGLAQLPKEVPYELRVLGKGPLQGPWQRLAHRIGVAPHTTWMGWLPHEEALQQYAWADVFVFSSLRDTTGTVSLEALGNGVPVICLDHQGVHDVVTEQSGVKIPVTTPHKVIAGLGEAIARLAHDEAERERLSRGAVLRARDYLWSRQGERMAAMYETPLDSGSERAPLAERGSRPDRKVRSRKVRSGRTAEGTGILMYHRIAPRTDGVPDPTWNVTSEQFREQLSGLLARGFRPISLSEVLRYVQQGRSLPRRSFAVTFDDGYGNFCTHARPILQELSVPATVFVATAYLDTRCPFPFDDWVAAGSSRVPATAWMPMSTEQCVELRDDALVEVGTHTHTHAYFRRRADAFYLDLQTSMEAMRRLMGLERVALAFPFGFVERQLVVAAHRAGVSCALTIQRRLVRPHADLLQLGRFGVEQRDSPDALAYMNSWSPTAK